MKRHGRWPVAAFALAALALAARPKAAAAEARKRVAFISWNDAILRYSVTRKGFLEQLNQEGFTSDNVDFLLEDAKGDKKNVLAIIKKLKSAGVDVWVPLGTSAAVPVAQAVQDKPVVFGMVYDPVAAKIVKDWAASGNNCTGASSFVSIPGMIRRIVKRSEGTWTVKKIGVILTPGEENSEQQFGAVKSVERELGLQVIPLPVADARDVAALGKALAGKADLIFVTGSNVVASNLPAIVAAASRAKIPTMTHLDDLVDRGVLIGLVADPLDIGRLGGTALAQVLNGAAPSSIPIKYPLPRLKINRRTAVAGHFTIPPALLDWAASAGTR